MSEETFSEPVVPYDIDPEPKGCTMCERIGALFGIAIGAVLLFVGVDLLTNGAISAMISGRKAVDDE